MHFIATGALSNLALLLTVYPDIKQYLEQISIMGGSSELGNMTPAAEFNICKIVFIDLFKRFYNLKILPISFI